MKTLVRGRGGGETVGGAILLITWLIGIKHPKQITLCETSTVILQLIVIIIGTWFLPIYKKY